MDINPSPNVSATNALLFAFSQATPLGRYYPFPWFTDEETEVQEGYAANKLENKDFSLGGPSPDPVL